MVGPSSLLYFINKNMNIITILMNGGFSMLKKTLKLPMYSGLSMVILMSIVKTGNCAAPHCGALELACKNKGCAIYEDKALYDPKETREQVMINARWACEANLNDNPCQKGNDLIQKAGKDGNPMCLFP